LRYFGQGICSKATTVSSRRHLHPGLPAAPRGLAQRLIQLQQQIKGEKLSGPDAARHTRPEEPSEFPIPVYGAHDLEPTKNPAVWSPPTPPPAAPDHGNVEQIRDRLLARFPAAHVALITNPGPAPSIAAARRRPRPRPCPFPARRSALRLDYCSNATGVDWPDKEITDVVKTTVPDPAGGAPKIVEEKTCGCSPAVSRPSTTSTRWR